MDHSGHNLLQAGSQTAISDRMRELLARAAQEHVYEQRTQAAVVGEIRQRLDSVEWLLHEIREHELGGFVATLDSLTARFDELTAQPPAWGVGLAQQMELLRDHSDAVADQTRGLTEQMAEIDRRLGQLRSSVDAAAGRFTRLDKAIAELTGRADRLESTVVDRLDRIDKRVDEATHRVRQLAAESCMDDLLADTVMTAVAHGMKPAQDDILRRLEALEETMFALAEALLRPTPGHAAHVRADQI